MKDNDEPAFPRDHQHLGHNGMTLRDYFAAKAMQGFLANPYLCERWGCESGAISAEAYQMADAMLAERAKP